MKLTSMTVRNFMPYKGDQSVQFPEDPKCNVMVVFGENMRGKTSFLNAIRWGFYGEALDRDRKRLSRANLANMDAARDGDWQFAVQLRFEANGHRYDLRRLCKPKETAPVPRHDSDFDIELSLSRDDSVVRSDRVEHELSQIVPPQVSRFFLFDAELLAEYQELLSDESEQGRKIKVAIEQVLGVPALLNGRVELRSLLKRAQEVLAKENKHIEGKRAQSELFTQLQGELDTLNADLDMLKAKEGQYRSEITVIEAELSRTAAAQRAQGRLDALRARLKDLKGHELELKQDTLRVVANAWKDLVQPRLQGYLDGLLEQQHQLSTQLESRGALRARIDQLRSIVSGHSCALCEQKIGGEQRERFGAELGRLEAELGAAVADTQRLGEISSQVARLSRLQGTGARERLRSNQEMQGRVSVEITKVEGEIEAVDEEVKGFDSAEIARLRSRCDGLHVAVGRTLDDIARASEQITQREQKKSTLSRLLVVDPTARTLRSATEVELYSALERLFAKGIDVLRDRLRESVAREASRAFMDLTTEKSYTGLRINKNYGLTIIDREGRAVSVRSAGAEQIVALSLIDGLNRTSGRSAPIIIDTPLGRLDPRHRANVLAHVPNMGEQVVLLVHEGEIERTTGLQPLQDRIGSVYDIVRVSSSHSVIRKE